MRSSLDNKSKERIASSGAPGGGNLCCRRPLWCTVFNGIGGEGAPGIDFTVGPEDIRWVRVPTAILFVDGVQIGATCYRIAKVAFAILKLVFNGFEFEEEVGWTGNIRGLEGA